MSFPAGSTSLCTSQTFPAPVVPSTQIASIASSLVTNFSGSAPSSHTFNHPNITFSNLSFCNITVKYSHPEHDDLITVMAWLPIDTWNGRFQAVGGGGASAGLNDNSLYGMKAAIGEGYATITTNAGQINNTHDFSGWGVDKNGRPNVDVLRDLAFVSLRDEALIGKRLIKSFYGQEPMFSYWSGCSQGGRQGLMLAQRYPTLYDGIVASSPAINWAQYYPGMVWPQVVMNALGMYPDGCELDYLTEEVISACDGLDGVKDGIISAMDRCSFDPFAYVGQGFNCSTMGITKKLSKVAAIVANETWTGPRDRDGNFLWYGLNYGADLSGDLSHGEAYAETSCSDNGTCIGQPLDRGTQWLQIFVEDNSPSFDFNAITIVEFARLFGLSVKKYDELIGTANPDLSEFKSAGGKMLGYHGLADPKIPEKGSVHYYERVMEKDPKVHDFYRFFEIPGLGHCGGGSTNPPTGIFDALRAWVENSSAPDSLPITFEVDGEAYTRPVCPYPQSAMYSGVGNPALESSYACLWKHLY